MTHIIEVQVNNEPTEHTVELDYRDGQELIEALKAHPQLRDVQFKSVETVRKGVVNISGDIF